MTIRLSRDFRDVRQLLTKPYGIKYQTPVESRLRTSPGRIVAVGLIEERNGQLLKPRFVRFYEEWQTHRGKAVTIGYEVKTFEEYLEKKPKES